MTSNFHNIQDATRTAGGNVVNSKVLSGKKRDVFFSSTYIGNNVGYVESKIRADMSQGSIKATGIATDFSFSGPNAFAVVKRNPNDPNGENLFTRSNSCRIDKSGNLVNSSGYHLMVWQLDDHGGVPANYSSFDSLVSTNLNNRTSASKPSSEIYISSTLKANQKALKGAGQLFKIDRSGINANLKDDDIILPEKALKQGDSFILTSTPPARPKTFVYGGISISRKITDAPIYQASGSGQAFHIVDGAPGDTQLQSGTGLSVTYKGVTHNLKAKVGSNEAENEFSSLDTLAKTIARIDGLKAMVKGGRLLVSSDGNEAVAFANDNSNMKETLGLVNIEAQDPANGERFSSLNQFKKLINGSPETFGLQAENIKGGLDIHSRVATSGFNMRGSSLGVTKFERASIGDGTEIGKSTVTIDSPNHALRTGDFVKLSGQIGAGVGATNVPEGIYMINSVNDDQFTIYTIHTHIGLMAPAAAAAPLPVPPNTTWQKIAGTSFPRVPLAGVTITAVNGANNGPITITNAGHGLADNNVIYVSGIYGLSNGRDITVPAGYYIVTGVAGNNFNITPSNNIGGAGLVGAVGPFTYQKVGAAAGGVFAPAGADVIGNFNTKVMETFAAGAQPGRVRVYLPNNNYSVRDFFSTNLTANKTVGGMLLEPGKQYQITARDANWIEFQPPLAGVAVAANDVITYGDPAQAAEIGIDFCIDHYAKTCDYLGMQQDKFNFDATYAAGDDNLSLASAKHSADGRVIVHTVNVYDSLGASHEMLIYFAKLDNNRWAVEIAAKKQTDGSFDVITDKKDGLIKSGIVEFNNDGSFATASNLANFQMLFNNGSAPSNININWEQIVSGLNGQVSSGIKQNGDHNDIRIDADGYKSGTITSVEIDSEGYIIASFSNGETQKLYQVATAIFDNIDALIAGDSGTYRASKDSGPARFGFAGVNGVPTINSKAIETSNIDITEGLLDLNEIGQYSNATFSSERMQREAEEKAINNLTR